METIGVPVRKGELHGQEAFDEITRRLSPEQLSSIHSKFQKISYLESECRWLKMMFEARNMTAIAAEPNSPYLGLKAVQLGYLTQHQFGTLQAYWQASEHHRARSERVESMSLFTQERKVNLEARAAVIATLRVQNPVLLGEGVEEPLPLLTEQQVDEWIEEMRKTPESEQQFFVVPDLNPYDRSNMSPDDVSHAILASTGLNLFCRFEEKGQKKRMLATAGMVQTFLKVKCGEDAVWLNHVLGNSSMDDIRLNGLTDTRDVQVAFPDIPTPERADGYWARVYNFLFHDQNYHTLIASFMPRSDRLAMVRAGDVVAGLLSKEQNSIHQQALTMTRDGLYDMECVTYSPLLRSFFFGLGFTTKNDLFWSSFIARTWVFKSKSGLNGDLERTMIANLVDDLPRQFSWLASPPFEALEGAQIPHELWKEAWEKREASQTTELNLLVAHPL